MTSPTMILLRTGVTGWIHKPAEFYKMAQQEHTYIYLRGLPGPVDLTYLHAFILLW
jgi:hypothetical protein